MKPTMTILIWLNWTITGEFFGFASIPDHLQNSLRHDQYNDFISHSNDPKLYFNLPIESAWVEMEKLNGHYLSKKRLHLGKYTYPEKRNQKRAKINTEIEEGNLVERINLLGSFGSKNFLYLKQGLIKDIL